MSTVDHVNNVGAVKTLTARDKQLGEDQFFRAQNAHRNAEELGRSCAVNPGSIYLDDPIAHAGDEIDEKLASVGFGKPDGVSDFALEAIFLKDMDRPLGILGREEKIQIFGVTIDAGMRLQSESAGDNERNTLVSEQLQHFPEQVLLVWRELRRTRRADGQQFLLLA